MGSHYSVKDATELAALLVRELDSLGRAGPIPTGLVAKLARLLCSTEKALRHVYELDCDAPSNPRRDAIRARLEKVALKCGRELGITVVLNSDPRGSAVQLKLPSGRSNNMGGETWAV